ncbi:MAG TPA: G1 family glutamic endopeptidase [Solirubrobacteraceae bacterium]
MRKQTLWRTRLTRGMAVLACVPGAAFGATAAAAMARSHHHHANHRRYGHGVCYTTRHHHRTRAKCSTTTTTSAPAHGHGISLLGLATLGSNQSNNWSGYNQGTIEQGSKLFHSITAGWTVPKASQHTSGQAEYSADWIGIGGGCVDSSCAVTDPTLIQTGTEQDVSSTGTPSYSAWWELIPAPSLTITSMKVHPGDRMSASIAELVSFSDVWTITIKDLTDGQSYSNTVPYPSTHATAEWIQETPLILGTGAGFAAQPNLTSPAFDLASTNGAPAKLKPSEQIQLIDSTGKVIGTPSSPDPDTDGFNVCAWAGTCSAPTAS